MVFKTRLKGNNIVVPKEIMRILGLSDGSEILITVSGDKIVISPYREEPPDVEGHIEWLRRNAPECFSEKRVVVRDKWVSVDWMRRKLGLKQ